MALYSQITLYINGTLLAENTTIETALEADIQDVMTITQGWTGITPSPVVRSVTATNVIPQQGGDGIDFEDLMLQNTEVTMKMVEGSDGGQARVCETDGYIVSVPRSAAVGQTTTISFTFRGKPAKFESII